MDTRVASLAWGIVALESQFSGEGLVQQRLLQRLQRGVLPLGEAGEALGFFRQRVELGRNLLLFSNLRKGEQKVLE